METPKLAFEPRSPYPVSRWDWYTCAGVWDKFDEYAIDWANRKITRNMFRILAAKADVRIMHRNRNNYNKAILKIQGLA